MPEGHAGNTLESSDWMRLMSQARPGDVPALKGTKDKTMRMLRKPNSTTTTKRVSFSLSSFLPGGSNHQAAADKHSLIPADCRPGERGLVRG